MIKILVPSNSLGIKKNKKEEAVTWKCLFCHAKFLEMKQLINHNVGCHIKFIRHKNTKLSTNVIEKTRKRP